MKKDIMKVFFPNLIKMFVMLFSTFILPRYLSVEEYGNIKLYQLYASYIGLSSLGYCDGVFIKYGGKQIEQLSRKSIANDQTTIILWQVMLTILVTIIGKIKKDFILMMVGLSFLPSVMVTYFLTLFQSIGLFDYYSLLYNLHSILTLLFNVVLLLITRSAKSFIIATVFVSYIVFFIIIISFSKRFKIPKGMFQWSNMKENIKLGVLITAGNMAYVVFSGIDKWFVKINEGMSQFSYYAFAVQLLSIINMFVNPIAYTLFSYFSRRKSTKFEYYVQRGIIAWLFFLLSGIFVIKQVVVWYIPKYEEAIPVIILLFFSQAFYSLNNSIYVNLYKVYRKQKIYFRNLLLVIVVSIACNYIFYFFIEKNISSFAYATIICMLFWTVLNMKSFKYMIFNLKDMLFVILATLLYFVINDYVESVYALIIYLVGYLVLIFLFMRDEVRKITTNIKDKLDKV